MESFFNFQKLEKKKNYKKIYTTNRQILPQTDKIVKTPNGKSLAFGYLS